LHPSNCQRCLWFRSSRCGRHLNCQSRICGWCSAYKRWYILCSAWEH